MAEQNNNSKKPSVYREMLKDLWSLKRKIDNHEPILVHRVTTEGGRMVIRKQRMPASKALWHDKH